MKNLEVKYVPIDTIKEYENNAKLHPDEQVAEIALSISKYGFNDPIAIDKDGVIVAGHGRLKAAKLLNMETVPVIKLDHMSEEEKKAYILAHNKLTMNTGFDFDKLKDELDSLTVEDMDLEIPGFSDSELSDILEGIDSSEPEGGVGKETKYTQKIDIPQYQITGEKPSVEVLVDKTKSTELISQIESSNIPDEIKEFLTYAAYRHNVFNYQLIAEFYAHAEKNIQELMEASALVIIDYEDAIKNGYVKLTKNIEKIMNESGISTKKDSEEGL